MAHHFIPQYYLKGFTVTRKHYLYVFEKGTQKYCELPIKSIGCRSKYYSQNIEQHLANSVENPANKIIRKIRNKEAISKNEKEIFSRYITSMWKRVPSWKGKFKERAPAVSEKLKKELTYSLDNYVQANPQKAEQIENEKKKINDILNGYAKNPPKEIWLQNIPPERSSKITKIINNMNWLFLYHEESFGFLTCDNPYFYFDSIGIGHRDSEISLPLSKDIALLATWKTHFDTAYIKVKKQVIKEINRRTVYNSLKYIYYGKYENWISKFVAKNDWKLNRLII